jgi:DNA polymerase
MSSLSSVKDYDKLVKEIMECKKCRLYKSRTNPVPGEGPITANVMVIGEAPGRKEDEQGRPFVGPAGQLLTRLLELAGLKRSEVYITNVVKCRPPGNRDPQEDEIETCLPYLLKQIELIKPKIIIAVGRHAARTLYALAGLKWYSMSKQHGEVREATIAGVKVKIIPTYHPAAALYKPPIREVLEKDFQGPIAKAIRSIKHDSSRPERRQLSLFDFMSKPGSNSGSDK